MSQKSSNLQVMHSVPMVLNPDTVRRQKKWNNLQPDLMEAIAHFGLNFSIRSGLKIESGLRHVLRQWWVKRPAVSYFHFKSFNKTS